MIQGMLDTKRRYLVSQANVHVSDTIGGITRIPILLTDYDDLGLAKIHFNALNERYAAIIDLEKPAHRRKLEQMLYPDSPYRVYAAFIDSMRKVEKRLNDTYSKKIRNYVAKNTTWRISADNIVSPKLQLIFGELFVILRYAGQEIRFKLLELRNY